MPLYRIRNVLEARRIKAFLNLETESFAARCPVTPPSEKQKKLTPKATEARQEIAEKDCKFNAARKQLENITERVENKEKLR